MLSVAYDRTDKIVRSTSSGFHTVEEVDAYAKAYQAAMADSLADCGEILVLIDARKAVVQSQDIIEKFRRLETVFSAKGARIAVLFDSSLAKMQANRNFVKERQQGFLSPSAALLWLSAGRESRGLPVNIRFAE